MSSLVDPGAVLDPYELASAAVRGYCGQQFDRVLGDVVLIDPRPNGTAQLPEMPVTAVTQVQAWMPDNNNVWGWQTLSYPGRYGWATRGLLWDATVIMPPIVPLQSLELPAPTWPSLPASLKVTYDHGYAPIPAEIQAIVTRLAAQFASNPAFLQSRKVGEVGYVYGTFPGGVMLRDIDRKILDRYTVQEVS